MLNDDQIEGLAQRHVKDAYPADCEILFREKHSNPDGVYFVANRRSENPFDGYLGDGGFFVSRTSGEIWTFGSGQLHRGLGYCLRLRAEGWREGSYRLVVRKVARPVRLAELFIQSQLTYVVLELEHGVVWSNRGVQYDEKTILQRLQKLPCSFSIFTFRLRELIPALESEGVAVVEYSYIENERTYDWHPEKYTVDQLGPQWE